MGLGTENKRPLLEDPEPQLQDPAHGWAELLLAPGVGGLAHDFGLRRIGVDGRGELAETDAMSDRQRQAADHLAGVLGNEGRAEDSVLPLLENDAQETLALTVEDGAVDVLEGHGDQVGRVP